MPRKSWLVDSGCVGPHGLAVSGRWLIEWRIISRAMRPSPRQPSGGALAKRWLGGDRQDRAGLGWTVGHRSRLRRAAEAAYVAGQVTEGAD